MFFMLAILTVPVAWIINHVEHNFQLGWMIGVVALILGLTMALHCGNTLQSLKRIATDLNKEMAPLKTFEYDLGKETEHLRYAFTLAGKIIGCVLLLWCFIPWPQL
jgi:ABC-type lipoprotein release transport system permease subunit